ncbi:MAG: hypothetical protein B6I24_09300 [Bacteroidetes bacterium 4572_128]|nr:MAG: hypothetical protein B6I24_09300 [Bacteroidetes bacterium 4572_128]
MDDCFLSKIPLLNLQKKEQNYFANKVKEILELGKEQNKLQNKFINRINTNFKILKFGKKLKNFYLYNFVDFLIELEKVAYPIKKSSINNKKIKLTIRQQDEWEDYFLYYKDNLQKIVKDIESKKNNINNKIYKIYGLTKSEIELIEKF